MIFSWYKSEIDYNLAIMLENNEKLWNQMTIMEKHEVVDPCYEKDASIYRN